MNEKYLFRGKRKDNGEWVYGGIYYQKADEVKEEAVYIIGGSLNYLGTAYEVVPETVGQCIDLKDKNGKLIFEGDIVKDKESGLLGKVIFATAADGFDGMTGFMVDDVDDGLQNYNGFWHLTKVIGNIHDNPELLEVGK